jgi:hypothetical protein
MPRGGKNVRARGASEAVKKLNREERKGREEK